MTEIDGKEITLNFTKDQAELVERILKALSIKNKFEKQNISIEDVIYEYFRLYVEQFEAYVKCLEIANK